MGFDNHGESLLENAPQAVLQVELLSNPRSHSQHASHLSHFVLCWRETWVPPASLKTMCPTEDL